MTADRLPWQPSPVVRMTGQYSTRSQYMAFVMLRLEGESVSAIARWAGRSRPTVVTGTKHSDAPLRVGRVLLELAKAVA